MARIARNGTECLQLVGHRQLDVVFLDTRMPDIDGLKVAETVIREEDLPLVVFVTDLDECAVQAFGPEAVDCAVKGISLGTLEQRVGETVERLERVVARKASSLDALREPLARLTAGRAHCCPGRLPVKDHDEGTVRLIDPAPLVYVPRSDGWAGPSLQSLGM